MAGARQRYARWIVAAALVFASAWPAQLAAFHYWAAGGPPTPEPAKSRHAKWGDTFAVTTLALWASAALSLWLLRPKRSLPHDEAT